MNILLGVLDDGRLTDSKGRTVSFANTVIIMTSNLGSDLLLEHGNSQMAKDLVMGVVKQHFRPEFLNRLDDVVMFEPLGQLQLREVAAKMVRLFPSFSKVNFPLESTADAPCSLHEKKHSGKTPV